MEVSSKLGAWGRGRVNAGQCPLVASRCNCVAGRSMHIAARATRDAAESCLPVIVPVRAAPAPAISVHGMVDVTALDVTTTEADGCGDMWVGASCIKGANGSDSS
jgi:hypothetical protein